MYTHVFDIYTHVNVFRSRFNYLIVSFLVKKSVPKKISPYLEKWHTFVRLRPLSFRPLSR